MKPRIYWRWYPNYNRGYWSVRRVQYRFWLNLEHNSRWAAAHAWCLRMNVKQREHEEQRPA